MARPPAGSGARDGSPKKCWRYIATNPEEIKISLYHDLYFTSSNRAVTKAFRWCIVMAEPQPATDKRRPIIQPTGTVCSSFETVISALNCSAVFTKRAVARAYRAYSLMIDRSLTCRSPSLASACRRYRAPNVRVRPVSSAATGVAVISVLSREVRSFSSIGRLNPEITSTSGSRI